MTCELGFYGPYEGGDPNKDIVCYTLVGLNESGPEYQIPMNVVKPHIIGQS